RCARHFINWLATSSRSRCRTKSDGPEKVVEPTAILLPLYEFRMRSSPLNLLPSLLLGSLLSLVGLAASVSGMERPNFVWILSEDNSYHYLKPFCKTGAETPRIEAMAK